jgi:hypothetical protein
MKMPNPTNGHLKKFGLRRADQLDPLRQRELMESKPKLWQIFRGDLILYRRTHYGNDLMHTHKILEMDCRNALKRANKFQKPNSGKL